VIAPTWDRVKQVFTEAAELPPESRDGYLNSACGQDRGLRGEVESMLSLDSAAADFLETPLRVMALLGDKGADEPELPAGTRIGRFTIVRLLARGGTGAVYEAKQESPQRIVAVKVIQAGLATPRAVRRLEMEAEALAKLDDPGIARVIEAGVYSPGGGADEGSRPFFAMELVRGRDLAAFAVAEGLGIRAKLILIASVCDAVHHAHLRGVIHRDLKPGNILVTEDGRPKVLDFGVARLTGLDSRATLDSLDTRLVGTVQYMSPEQVMGSGEDVDPRSDVYSLGVVLYELLAGCLPYPIESVGVFEALHVIRTAQPASLGAISRGLRGDVTMIVGKALEKDPARRYQSASEFAADIRRFLNREPITARPASRVYRVRRFAERNPALSIAVLVAALSVMGGLAVSSWQAVRATRAEMVARNRREDIRRAANTLITNLYDRLRSLPGTESARQLIAAEVSAALESLYADSGDDPALIEDYAAASEKLGNVSGNPGDSNLGDTEACKKFLDRAIALRERLYAMNPEDARYATALSITYLNRAIPEGDLAQRKEYYTRAKQIMAHAMETGNPDYEVVARYGSVLMQSGAEAVDRGPLDELADSVSIFRSLLTADPSDAKRQDGFGISSRYYGTALVARGSNRARAVLTEARRSLENALAQNAEDYSAARHIVFCDIGLARVALNESDFARMDNAIAHALDPLERFAQQDPNSSFFRHDRIDCAMQVAIVCADAGKQRTDQNDARAVQYHRAIEFASRARTACLDKSGTPFPDAVDALKCIDGFVADCQAAIAADPYPKPATSGNDLPFAGAAIGDHA
jgi:tetratricopeptide (TPR) repeat protein